MAATRLRTASGAGERRWTNSRRSSVGVEAASTNPSIRRKGSIGGCRGVVMGKQRTFASMAWQGKGKVTRRERLLAEMDAMIPWPRLLALIEPHYGRPAVDASLWA